ncbi:hypothetical protein K7X08_023174 [Anisodus acutangulus]|uniref:Uncharacterized protein n=1 Tax=Anisodus acutangulus TaxID=402998 RepID=A0A9Q1R0C6_9SOLA|nr:hypothetical protein K7X08_023174 [Anisodus acutangulus]
MKDVTITYICTHADGGFLWDRLCLFEGNNGNIEQQPCATTVPSSILSPKSDSKLSKGPSRCSTISKIKVWRRLIQTQLVGV